MQDRSNKNYFGGDFAREYPFWRTIKKISFLTGLNFLKIFPLIKCSALDKSHS